MGVLMSHSRPRHESCEVHIELRVCVILAPVRLWWKCEDLLLMRKYYVYILTNATHTVLYIGFTGNIENRIAQHKRFRIKGFTQKYRAGKLVYI